MRVIVNASGAKHGGARTIVESYCSWIEKNDTEKEYIFIVGFDLITSSKNITVINLRTGGFSSLLFATFGVAAFSVFYQTNIIVSFMNLNTIFPFFNKITYFHQAKFFSERSLKFKIYSTLLRMQKNSTFVCQNASIKEKLEDFLGCSDRTQVLDLWPGIYRPSKTIKPSWYDKIVCDSKLIALCPYNDIRMPHKNFQTLFKSYDFLKDNNIQVIVTSKNYDYESNDVFSFVDSCSYSELHFLYEQADIVLFPSLSETVGLPIFEAQYYGVPVIVSDIDYIKVLNEKFPDLNIIKIKQKDFYFDVSKIEKNNVSIEDSCFIGEWHQLNDLL
ncbi:glycosyltransferase [Psychrobacter pacificensis]|uniref:glycosyltransferase n=1 Tax=Psychrobacter pacificensis TaxID=112002 RepID=UPI0028C3CD3D|nr:glycosyltransferase [Psychrobacter pacificensis]